jgi:formylglycine-generating enzyme required for sulfatase activity
VGGAWRAVPGREKHPVTASTFWGAEAYAKWVGGHLPTDVEWEKAARGTDGRDYPWGNEPPDGTYCNYGPTGLGDAAPVGSFPKGASPYGVMDMAGNVYERIVKNTEYSELPRAAMLKSGGFVCPMAFQMRVSDYCGYRTDASNASIGFRCVMRP